VLGLTGDTGFSTHPHIHYQYQRADGVSIKSTLADIGSPSASPTTTTYTSRNTALFDDVMLQSGRFNIADFRWYKKAWVSPTRAEDYAVVYLAPVLNGFSNDYVTYDAMRGARSAVRIYSGIWQHWDAMGGPGSYLGAPIGPRYTKNGLTVQDFLGGYIVWNGSYASDAVYPALYGPGAFAYGQRNNEPTDLLFQPLAGMSSSVLWSPKVSYLFVECYRRNGQGAALGYPTTMFWNQSVDANVSRWYVPGENRFYYVQRFSGGSLGECLIMYDPQNRGSYNREGENRAYLIKQGFLNYYLANNGLKMLGCPVSDEYRNQNNGLTYQDFQKGQLVWDGSVVSVQSYNPSTAYLWIDSEPAGGTVIVDGSAPYNSATTPTRLIGVNGGNHAVRVALVDEPEKTVTVTAIADQITDVFVTHQRGTVNITSTPGGVQLYHTGSAPWPAAGVLTPIMGYTLDAGTYSFIAKKEGYGDTPVEFAVQAGQTTEVDIRLNPVGFPYTLEAESMQGSAEVIDGARKLTVPGNGWYLYQEVNFPEGGRVECEIIAKTTGPVNGQYPILDPPLPGGSLIDITSTEWASYYSYHNLFRGGPWEVSLKLSELVRGTAGQTVIIDRVIFRYVPLPPPAAPSNLRATCKGLDVTLTWVDNSSDEEGFKGWVWLDDQTVTSWAPVIDVGANMTSATHRFGGYIRKALYRLKAYKVAGGITSEYSNDAVIYTLRPPVLDSLRVTSASSVSLFWHDENIEDEGCIIERKVSGGNFIEISRVPATTTSYQDLTVSGGTAYTYRLRLYRADHSFSSYSGEGSVTTPSSNLIANGGFESGQLTPWVFQNWPNLATATIISNTGEYKEGSKGLRVDITGLDQFWAIQLRQNFTATIQQHTIKFWAKAASSRTMTVDAQDRNTWTNLGLWQTVNLSTSWQQFTFTFTPPAGYPTGYIHFYFGEAMPTVWLDGVELTTASQSQPPSLSLSVTVVDLDSTKNTGSFVVRNSGGGTLNWSASKTSSALALSLASGTAPASDTVRVNLDRAQAAIGTHADTVKVTSNGGNGNVVVRYKILPPSNNLFTNGGFESGVLTPWVLQNNDNRGNATVTSNLGEYAEGTKALRINMVSPNIYWEVHVRQKYSVTQGQSYTLSFQAKASANRTMLVDAQERTTWTNLGLWQTVNLTTSWQQFTYNFTPGKTTADAWTHFMVGDQGPAVWLDDVRLATGTPPPPPPPPSNILTNGGFETGSLTPWIFQNYPNLATATCTSASGEYQEGTKGLRVNITGLDQFWSIQVRQNFACTVQQHTIKFWAKAASNRTMTVDAQDAGGSWTNLNLWQTVSLTTSWQQFTFTFTPPAGYPNGVVHFYLGEAMPSVWIDGVQLVTGIGKVAADMISEPIPTSFALYQNHPNPFNPITTFRFDLPELTHVRLIVHNILGKQIEVITDGVWAAGSHQIAWDASQLHSGVYFYILEAEGRFRATRKLLLLK